jgi:pimeloyl-ACP methyl ester carboxylesterase
MYVEEHGPTDGVPIVFLHGSMVAGWMWMGQVADLPEYRCLLPDLPGIGNSADESWISFADTGDRIAEMIRARCANGSTHLVGLSLGGITGLHVAARHPDLVRSLIVSGVPYGKIPSALRVLSTVMLGLYHRPWGARVVARLFGIPPDESMDAFMQTARQTDPASLRALTDEVSKMPLPQSLEKVTVPTLAVVGEKDTTPARRAVPHLQEVMPNAVGCVGQGVGHQWNAENQEMFSDMVRQWITAQTVNDLLELVGDQSNA